MEEKVSDTNIVAQEKKRRGGVLPRVLTEDEIQTVERLAASLNVKQIANYFGISEKTFFDIRSRQPKVATAYKKGKARAIEFVASKLWNLIEDGHPPSIYFYLKTQAGWRESGREDGKSEDEDSENNNGPTPLLVKFVTKEDLKDVTENKDDKTQIGKF